MHTLKKKQTLQHHNCSYCTYGYMYDHNVFMMHHHNVLSAIYTKIGFWLITLGW